MLWITAAVHSPEPTISRPVLSTCSTATHVSPNYLPLSEGRLEGLLAGQPCPDAIHALYCPAPDGTHPAHVQELGRSRQVCQRWSAQPIVCHHCDYCEVRWLSRNDWAVVDIRCASIRDASNIPQTFFPSLLSSRYFAARSFETLTSPVTLMIVDILAVTSSFFCRSSTAA